MDGSSLAWMDNLFLKSGWLVISKFALSFQTRRAALCGGVGDCRALGAVAMVADPGSIAEN